MAQQTVVPPSHCIALPDALDDATAAAIANPGMSAWAALRSVPTQSPEKPYSSTEPPASRAVCRCIPMNRMLASIHALLEATIPAGFQIATQTFPLSEIDNVWSCPSTRLAWSSRSSNLVPRDMNGKWLTQ